MLQEKSGGLLMTCSHDFAAEFPCGFLEERFYSFIEVRAMANVYWFGWCPSRGCSPDGC